MNKKIILGAFALSITCFFQVQAADLAGRWKTIDDKTGYARAEVLISKLKDGSYTGKIVKVHAIPNRTAIDHCDKCEGKLKNAPLIGLPIFSGFHQDDENKNEYNDVLELPKTNEYNALFTSWVALQLFAYYIADELWREIDKPRNLAKSVTVE